MYVTVGSYEDTIMKLLLYNTVHNYMKLHLARLNGSLKSAIVRHVTDETAMDFNALPLIVRFFLFIDNKRDSGATVWTKSM